LGFLSKEGPDFIGGGELEMDPIRFAQDLKVTIQALGWRSGGRYLPQKDDISSTAFWYQSEPHQPFPTLPDRDGLEVI
jgi:hypothetical protein